MKLEEFFEKVQNKLGRKTITLSFLQCRVSLQNGLGGCVFRGDAEEAYVFLHFSLQEFGMARTNGEEDYDRAVWEDATRHLEAIRAVLNEEFTLDLPQLVVRSLVEEAVREGFFGLKYDSNGRKLVTLETNPLDVQIRIVNIPRGGAPEAIRQEWIGVELPARYIEGTHPTRNIVTGKLEFYDGAYMVSSRTAVETLQKKSPVAAAWFIDNVNIDDRWLFNAQCAQTINVQ